MLPPSELWLTVGTFCFGLCAYVFIVTGMVAEEFGLPIVYHLGSTLAHLLLIESGLSALSVLSRRAAWFNYYILRQLLWIS